MLPVEACGDDLVGQELIIVLGWARLRGQGRPRHQPATYYRSELTEIRGGTRQSLINLPGCQALAQPGRGVYESLDGWQW